MDYERTRQLYEEIGQLKKFEETPDFNRYKKEQKWNEKVKSKRTGEYHQAEYLKNKDIVSPKWTLPHVDGEGRPLEYPLKYVNGIFRVRIADGTEWLKSTQEWWGLDSAGNALNLSMNYKECFDEIRPFYTSKPKTRERDAEMILEITSIEHNIKYTLPFTPENAQKLYDMRNGSCSLVIKDESRGDKPPYEVASFEHFKSRSFDELWEWAITPRFSLDRSVKDQLQDSQYG
jgi:hypothetical protein